MTFSSSVTCPLLTPPDNGRIECAFGADGVLTEGGNCIYICDEGFGISGSISRECQSDGNWSGSEPTCGKCKMTFYN